VYGDKHNPALGGAPKAGLKEVNQRHANFAQRNGFDSHSALHRIRAIAAMQLTLNAGRINIREITPPRDLSPTLPGSSAPVPPQFRRYSAENPTASHPVIPLPARGRTSE